MLNPLFSILVANYNNGLFFKDCYDSLLAQDYKFWECIIVDDCSSDDSVKLIEKIIKDDSRFKLFVNEKNEGCGYTKRKCVELAAGQICGFVDPDDALMSEALTIMSEAHQHSKQSTLIYSDFYVMNARMEPIKRKNNIQVINGQGTFFNIEGNISHFASFKINTYNQTEGINQNLKRAVDQDLYLKLYEKGEVKYLNKCLYKYRVHEKGISNCENKGKAYFWFWKVIFNAAERRNVNIENLFEQIFIDNRYTKKLENSIALVKNSRWIKIGKMIGLFKSYKYLNIKK